MSTSGERTSNVSRKITIQWLTVAALLQAAGAILIPIYLDKIKSQQEENAQKTLVEQARIAENTQQHQIMSDYLKQMADLVLNKGLTADKPQGKRISNPIDR